MYNYLVSQFKATKLNRPVVVIESDDWGSERIPNIEVREKLIAFGLDMESNPHAKFDTLERLDDFDALENLFDDLRKKYNKKIKITANFITANPDFNKIKKENFEKYHYETFQNTYFKRDSNDKTIQKIKYLINKGFIAPQFHGREHINVSFWLEELRKENKWFRYASEHNCYAIDAPTIRKSKNLMATLVFENKEQFNFIAQSLQEGHNIFKEVFGTPSSTFIAPRYTWNEDLNPIFVKEKFTHLQSAIFQQSFEKNSYKPIFRYTGQKNKNHDLKYLVRNVFFEPAYGKVDWVNAAYRKIEWAFKFKTPAIISMHRINFVGGLDSNQRDKNLVQFKILLERIIKKYPNVEFLGSDELAKLI